MKLYKEIGRKMRKPNYSLLSAKKCNFLLKLARGISLVDRSKTNNMQELIEVKK